VILNENPVNGMCDGRVTCHQNIRFSTLNAILFLLLALRTGYCAHEFRQNGSSPLIYDVINIPNIGLLFRKITL